MNPAEVSTTMSRENEPDSPHVNLDVEGRLYIVTIETSEPVLIGGEEKDGYVFSTIQPGEEQTRERAIWHHNEEFDCEIVSLELEEIDGETRNDQLRNLAERMEDQTPRASETVANEITRVSPSRFEKQ